MRIMTNQTPKSDRPARPSKGSTGLGRTVAPLQVPEPIKGAIGFIGAVALWEVLRALNVIPPAVVASTWDICGAMSHGIASGELLVPLRETVGTWVVGLFATILVAVPLGLLVGLFRWADAATSLLFDIIRPVPAVALVPVAVVLLGLGRPMQVPLIVLAAMWPLMYNTRYGVRNVDPLLIDSGRSVGLTRIALLRRVVLPSSMPSVLTGLRLSATIALIVTIVTELVAAATGLGQYISLTQQAGSYAASLGGVLLAAILGTAIHTAAVLVEARIIGWQRRMLKVRQ